MKKSLKKEEKKKKKKLETFFCNFFPFQYFVPSSTLRITQKNVSF